MNEYINLTLEKTLLFIIALNVLMWGTKKMLNRLKS